MSEIEMSKWESAVEQAIREAQARGEFDNLPNQGKPLDLTPNPYAGDRELSYHILKQQGFAPAWIEEGRELRQAQAEACDRVRQAWERFQQRMQAARQQPGRRGEAEEAAQASWCDARQRFAAAVADINERIRLFNLKVPLVDKQRSPLVAEEMLASLGIRDDGPPAEGSTAAEPAPTGQETERGRLQEALYRLIQGREKMPLSPGWHNARRKAIFRYVDRLREMWRKP